MKLWALAMLLGLAQGAVAQEVSVGQGAVLRGLDKVDGDVTDMILTNGETRQLGRLSVEMHECRYPTGDPAGDAYALSLIHI